MSQHEAMTRDELMAASRESGLTDPDLGEFMLDYGDAEAGIKRFAALVAAREREACALEADARMENTSVLYPSPPRSSAALCIAAAIRARKWPEDESGVNAVD